MAEAKIRRRCPRCVQQCRRSGRHANCGNRPGPSRWRPRRRTRQCMRSVRARSCAAERATGAPPSEPRMHASVKALAAINRCRHDAPPPCSARPDRRFQLQNSKQSGASGNERLCVVRTALTGPLALRAQYRALSGPTGRAISTNSDPRWNVRRCLPRRLHRLPPSANVMRRCRAKTTPGAGCWCCARRWTVRSRALPRILQVAR